LQQAKDEREAFRGPDLRSRGYRRYSVVARKATDRNSIVVEWVLRSGGVWWQDGMVEV
jgi:hypothetical protein